MKTIAPPSSLVAVRDRALAVATTQSALAVRRHLRTVTADDFNSAWRAIAPHVTEGITLGQAAGIGTTTWFLEESLRTTTGRTLTLAEFGALIGVTATGTPVSRYVNRTPEIVQARVAGGMKAEQAIEMSFRQLVGMATTEPYRLARNVTAEVTITDRSFAGWRRVPEPGACSFCRMLATRGAAYLSKDTAAGRRYHQRCRCTAEPVMAAELPELNARLAAEWAEMDRPRIGRGSRAPVTTDEIAVLDRQISLERSILAENTRISGRKEAAERRIALLEARREASVARYFGTPEAQVALEQSLAAERLRAARLQLDQIEATADKLRLRLAGGDASAKGPLDWQTKRAAELRRTLGI